MTSNQHYKLMAGGPDGGWIRHHWNCTEDDALRFVERVGYMVGDRLVDGTGRTIRTY